MRRGGIGSVLLLTLVAAAMIGAAGAAVSADTGVQPPEGNAMTLAPGSVLARAMIGADVVSEKGEKLGTVQDLIVDDTGRITHGIVGVGGLLGLGEAPVAVAYNKLNLKENGGTWQAVMSQEALKTMPRFDYAVADTMAKERKAMAESMEEWQGRMQQYSEEAKKQASNAGSQGRTVLNEAWSGAQDAWSQVKNAGAESWEEAKVRFDGAMERLRKTWEEQTAKPN